MSKRDSEVVASIVAGDPNGLAAAYDQYAAALYAYCCTLLHEPAEKALHAAMQDVVPVANAQFEAGDYTASLQTLAALRGPVDAFFDGVMVMTDDVRLRDNRIALLAQLRDTMNRIADISRLAA